MTAVISQTDLSRLRALARQWHGEGRDLCAADLETALDEIEARRAHGGDVLSAKVYGGGVPEMHAAALLEAAQLWGPGADLTVEETGTVFASREHPGQFFASVRVRCLNYAEVTA